MFGHAKVQDVVEKMPKTLEEMAIPRRPMLSSGMDGPNVNKPIIGRLNKIKTEKRLLTACQLCTKLSHPFMS